MKILFLDIDGVLNSLAYDRIRVESDGNVDESRLPLIKRIIDSTGALVVLISAWRRDWDENALLCGPKGRELNRCFYRGGIEIYGKTGEMGDRRAEILAWLGSHPETESYAVIDDGFGGWGELYDRLVSTSYYKGRGLEEAHADRAIELLNTPLDGDMN